MLSSVVACGGRALVATQTGHTQERQQPQPGAQINQSCARPDGRTRNQCARKHTPPLIEARARVKGEGCGCRRALIGRVARHFPKPIAAESERSVPQPGHGRSGLEDQGQGTARLQVGVATGTRARARKRQAPSKHQATVAIGGTGVLTGVAFATPPETMRGGVGDGVQRPAFSAIPHKDLALLHAATSAA